MMETIICSNQHKTILNYEILNPYSTFHLNPDFKKTRTRGRQFFSIEVQFLFSKKPYLKKNLVLYLFFDILFATYHWLILDSHHLLGDRISPKEKERKQDGFKYLLKLQFLLNEIWLLMLCKIKSKVRHLIVQKFFLQFSKNIILHKQPQNKTPLSATF